MPCDSAVNNCHVPHGHSSCVLQALGLTTALVHSFAFTLTGILGASPCGVYCKGRHLRYCLLGAFQLSYPSGSQHLCFCMQVGFFFFVFHPKQSCNNAGYYPRAAQKVPGRSLSTKLNFGCKCCLIHFVVSQQQKENKSYQRTLRSPYLPVSAQISAGDA